MKYILYFFLFSQLLGCNDDATAPIPGSSEREKTSIDTQQTSGISGCYMKIVGRDTAILLLEQKGSAYSGKMLYDNFEKDGSRGIVAGKDDNGVIKLWYDFNSEGMHSVMEVYFKNENGKLLRGTGDMDAKADTAYFISGINYSDKEAFNKVNCDLIGWKLKF